MADNKEYYEHLDLIDLIVQTSDKLIPIFENNPELNEKIYKTVTMIYDFTANVIKSFPELISSSNNRSNIKKELIASVDKVTESWHNLHESPSAFFDSWTEFKFWWDEYLKMIKEIKDSDNTITLSMN